MTPVRAGRREESISQDDTEAALQKFEGGARRSIKQADAGLVKTFKTKGEFLDHLKNLE
jgi:hypothetical protein